MKTKLMFFILISIIFATHFGCDFIFSDGGHEPPANVDKLTVKDSLAVRAILDTNGLKNLNVHQVVSISNSMVESIILDSQKISNFIFINAFDSFSTGNIGIEILNCNIDTIAFHDTIHISMFISFSNTKLRSIPDRISMLKGRIVLNLTYNKLNYISPQIMNCLVNGININNNNLCSLNDTLKNWLIQKNYGDSSWIKTQNCP